jgi:hypothetical protein
VGGAGWALSSGARGGAAPPLGGNRTRSLAQGVVTLSVRCHAVGIGALAVAMTAGVIVAVQQPSSIATPTAGGSSAGLIQNGSFESPSIWQTTSLVEYEPLPWSNMNSRSTTMPGWTVGGNSIELVGENYWVGLVEDGEQSADLSGAAPENMTALATSVLVSGRRAGLARIYTLLAHTYGEPS